MFKETLLAPEIDSSRSTVKDVELIQPKEPATPEAIETSQEARDIAHLGSFNLIEQELKNRDFLPKEKERVQRQFSEFIATDDFPTTSGDLWDFLTILELYDPETATHSIRTYQLAKEKVEKALSKNILLSEIIKSEGVGLERFYFSCLAHDIGKVEIPHFIIQNTTSDDQWKDKLKASVAKEEYSPLMLLKLGFAADAKPTRTEMERRIGESCLCAKELLPVKEVLTEEETTELYELWNISPEVPFMDIIDKHADMSGKILEEKGFPTVAEIVRNHHHKAAAESYSVSIDSLQISSDMADILHLADVEQALKSVRSYKDSYTPLKTMKILIEHAEKEQIGAVMTYLWVKDEYENLRKQALLDNLGFEEENNLRLIENFLGEFESETGAHRDDLEAWINLHTKNKVVPKQEKIQLEPAV